MIFERMRNSMVNTVELVSANASFNLTQMNDLADLCKNQGQYDKAEHIYMWSF
jgi:hypothetical protein